MAAFIFSGDPKAPKSDPDECVLFGMTFPFGVPVRVDDAQIAERLRRHSHFTEVEDKPRRGRSPKVVADDDLHAV